MREVNDREMEAESAFQVLVRVRPMNPCVKGAEPDSYANARKSFNTIQVQDNVVAALNLSSHRSPLAIQRASEIMG